MLSGVPRRTVLKGGAAAAVTGLQTRKSGLRRATLVTSALTALTLGLVAAPASADPRVEHSSATVALKWQQIAQRTVYAPPSTPIPSSALYFGFTSLAMDAAVSWARAPGVSASAAAAVAAHDVLVAYFPASTALLDDDLAATLSTISGGRAKRTGIAVGRAAAAALVASRHGDGRNAPIVYSRNPAPGIWQPPPTGMAVPWLGFVKPLVLRTRITVDGPDPIGSAAYAADFDEVKRLGSATSTERTAAQTATAKFFNANSVLQLRQALLDHLERNPLSLARTTRLFAALDAATADALIQGWRLKYEIGFWRPFQAIPAADSDGNDATTADPTWAPLVPTPPYPDYVSGHALVVSAFTATVGPVLGDDVALRIPSLVTGVEPRTYPSLSAIEADALPARIWLGIHFRDAMEDGYRLGHLTGKAVRWQLLR